jgi:hypothetical protein
MLVNYHSPYSIFAFDYFSVNNNRSYSGEISFKYIYETETIDAAPLTFKRYCKCLSTEAYYRREYDPEDGTFDYVWDDKYHWGFGGSAEAAPTQDKENINLYDEYHKEVITIEDIRRYAFRACLKDMETSFYIWYKNCYDYWKYLLEHENNKKKIKQYEKLQLKLSYILKCINLIKDYFFTGDEQQNIPFIKPIIYNKHSRLITNAVIEMRCIRYDE